MAPGRGEAQGEIEGCCSFQEKGSWGPGVLDSTFLYSHSPFPEGYMRSQCRARPSCGLWGGLYPSQDRERVWEVLRQPPPQAGGSECNRQHNDRGEGRAKKVERISSQEAQGHPEAPGVGSSLQLARCWESLSPTPVQRQRLEVVKSGSLFCRSMCPSTTQASPKLPLASMPQPYGARRRPPFQPPLSARATLRGPVTWALWSLKLGEVGWKVRGIGAPVPRQKEGRMGN